MSVVSTNPATFFGGTWAAWGQGRVAISVDSGDSDFNAAEKTGGAKTHTLTVAEMPSHAHTQQYGTPYIAPSGGAAVGGMTSVGSTGAVASQQSTIAAGGGGAHNNLQPYITCYMWKRTA